MYGALTRAVKCVGFLWKSSCHMQNIRCLRLTSKGCETNMISSGLNSIPSVGISKASFTNTERAARVKTSREVNNCDSISISSPSSKENRFYLEVVSRLSREVRTATSTSDIRTLREEVSSGQYTPDPSKIAAAMLFLRENV